MSLNVFDLFDYHHSDHLISDDDQTDRKRSNILVTEWNFFLSSAALCFV